MRPFNPLLRSPHLLTILGNFWPRRYDAEKFPMQQRLIQTDPDTQVLVQTQFPAGPARAEVVMVHGLEGGGDAGYIRSMAWDCLHAGFIAHRFHMRTCGGTAHLCKTLYHAGLTSDLRVFLENLRAEGRGLPVFLIGFSLGGNVVLKLAGEEGAGPLFSAVCAISTPIDLAAGVRRIAERDNVVYHRRFVKRMRKRLYSSGRFSREELAGAKSIYEIDDRITAPSFGFENAEHYYATQSAQNFLHRIAVPTLLLQSRDDTFIPFRIFGHPAIRSNPHLTLLATDYGGHLGFLARGGHRFWMDEAVISFLDDALVDRIPAGGVTNGREAR